MSDPLTRVCGLPDLTPDDRRRLTAELDVIARVLARVDEGAGFCEDRGFGWTAEMERAEGTGQLFDRLRAWPILRRLLPHLRHYRHEKDPVIGVAPAPVDDVLVARILLFKEWSFTGQYGEGWGESTVSVRLEPDAIRVSERTVAGGIGDEPFSSSETTADYSEPRAGRVWADLAGKLSADTFRQAKALAERMGKAIVPCDRCGRPAQTYALDGASLVYDGPFSAPARVEVAADVRAALRRAFAAQDMPAVRGLNPGWTEGFCARCDASYCKAHLGWGQEGPEYLWVNPYARCPHGHCWDL